MQDVIAESRLLEISSNPSSAEYDTDVCMLVTWGLEHDVFGCEGFVLNPREWCKGLGQSFDELAQGYLEDAQNKSQAEKLVWLRGFLKSELQGPREDSPSFIKWSISVGSTGFTICAVVIFVGHEPVVIDYFAFEDAKYIGQHLRERDYLVTDSDIEHLTDEQLLALWD